MRRNFWKAAAVLVGMMGIWRGGMAVPLDGRIPADAVVYAGWAGADALGPAYAGSNLKGVIENTKIGAYVKENWAGWMAKAELSEEKVKEVNDGAAALKMLWRHPGAVYVGPMGFADIEKPTFRGAILCDAGEDAGALRHFVEAMLKKQPVPADWKMKVELDGTVVVVTFGEAKAEWFWIRAGAKVNRLPGVPEYAAAMGHLQKDAAVAVYVDAAKAVGLVEEAVGKVPDVPAEVKKAVPGVLQALGLKGLTQVSAAGGFDGKEWREEAFIGMTGPRVGLLSLMEGAAISEGALAMVPRDAVAMSAGRGDLVKVLGIVREVMGKANEEKLGEFEKGIKDAGKEAGFDIEKDLIGAMGDEWVTYRGPLADDGTYPVVLVQKVRDGAALGKALEAGAAKINALAEGKVKIEKLDAGKFEVSGVRLPATMGAGLTSIAWTIRGGVFYLSTLEGIGAAVEQVEGKGESITANAGYKAVRAALPNVKATAVSYAEPAKLYPAVYRSLMGYLPVARLVGVDLPGDLIPMPKKVSEFMGPCGSVTWSDGEGIHYAGRSAFPGAELMSGQASPAEAVGGVAVGTAILIPSLGRARVQAKQVVDMTNMRQFAQMCYVWAAEHDGKLPEHLGEPMLEFMGQGDGKGGKDVTRWGKMLVSTRSGTVPPALTAELVEKGKKDFSVIAKEIDGHCDFVYLGHGVKQIEAAADMVLLYEKPVAGTSGVLVCFFDGHVEAVPRERLAETFKSTNEFLKKNHFAEVDVEGLEKGLGGK